MPSPCHSQRPRRPRASDSAATSGGGVGLEDSVGCGERGPRPPSGPARLLSSPRPPRDEIPGTSLVTIVTLRPSLSCLATEEASANKKLWAVWGTPPWCGRGSGGAGRRRSVGHRGATLASVPVPPPRSVGTFPESAHEQALLPPRRGVANRVQPSLARRVACRIFAGWVGLKPPALVILLRKKSLRVPAGC